MAGSVALKLLENSLGVRIIAFTEELGDLKADVSSLSFEEITTNRYANEVRCPVQGTAEKMKELIVRERDLEILWEELSNATSSTFLLVWGNQSFRRFESEMARSIFSIPAVKGIEFGSGFPGSKRKGSQNNDIYSKSSDGKIITKTNNSGGVLGGLSTGMPIVFRVAFKPASSIASTQRTLDFSTMEERS